MIHGSHKLKTWFADCGTIMQCSLTYCGIVVCSKYTASELDGNSWMDSENEQCVRHMTMKTKPFCNYKYIHYVCVNKYSRVHLHMLAH